MNLRLAMAFLFYWLVMSLVFTFGHGFIGDSSTTLQTPDTSTFNSSANYTGSETGYSPGSSEVSYDKLSSIQKIFKTVLFMFFGVGLPSDTPTWFSIIVFLWQTSITILAILLVTDAIHTG
jgi:hypothetical protein